jgi:multidrug efflux system membrane fusion protein
MKSSKIIAILIAIIACIWMASGIITTPEVSEKDAPQEQAAEKALQKVRVRVIEAESYKDEVSVTGRTQASKSVEIKAEITGEVIEVLKQEGEPVEQGEVMAALDLRDKKEREVEALGRLKQRRIEYNAAKKLANKGFNSKVKLAQSLADLESAKAELKQAQVDLGQASVQAPFEGIILEQNIDMGDYVSNGDSMFSIVDLDPIEIVAFVSERKVQELTLNQNASAEFLNGEKIAGTLSYIAPAADEQTRTFRVIMSADNAGMIIKDGLTAKMKMPVKPKQAHRISPSILTLNTEGKIGVKIVNADDKVEFVPIKILADQSDAMWVSGPPASARFITVGQEFVIEGQTVEPVLADGEGLL